VSTWEDIEDRSYLDSISVSIIDAEHCDKEHLDWRLTARDESGTEFKLEIWQKHDPLLDWEAGGEYEIRDAYGQTWDDEESKKLHSSRKWSADRVDSSYDCRLVVMGDSHVGRAEHPSKPYKPIDCAGKFEAAIEQAVAHDADCVVHTGDVFHDAVPESDCETVDSAMELLDDAGIEFYYILGNHECDRGTRLLRRWEQRGVATHLDMDGSEVAPGVKLYGYDHRPASEFSVAAMDLPLMLLDSTSILALHQTLAPFRPDAAADLDEINEQPVGGFDYVVSGHLHNPERPEWNDGEFLYAGSTEDLSKTPDASDPSVWLLTVADGSVETRRQKL